MSETKLCPFLCAAVYLANLDGPAGTYTACLEDKCQMWRVAVKSELVEGRSPISRFSYEGVEYGYCGLAGKP